MIKGHCGPVLSVDFSNDSRYVVSSSADKSIKILSLSDRKFIGNYVSHKNWVRCVRFSPDARLLGSCSDDHTIKLWDVTKKTVIHTFIDHLEPVRVLRFSPDGTCLSSGSDDKKIKIFDIRSGRIIQHYDAHGASVTCLSYHPSGKYIISSSVDSTIKIWDLFNGQILYTMHGHEGPIKSVSFSRCGDYFCSGGADAILMIWKSNVMNEVNVESISNEIKTSSNLFKNTIGIDNIKKKEETKTNTKSFKNKNNTISKNVNKNVSYHTQKSVSSQNQSNLNKIKYNNISNQSEVNMQPSQISDKKTNPLMGSIKSNTSKNSNLGNKLPEELTMTFEKLISQLDIVVKTMKIMDQRIQGVENKVSMLYNNQKKGLYKQYQNEEQYDNYDEHINDQLNNANIDIDNQIEDNLPNMGTMKYYPQNMQQNNIFNQNLDEEYPAQIEGDVNVGIVTTNNNEQDNINNDIEQNKLPIGIFEDVKNHIEDINDVPQNINNEQNINQPDVNAEEH